MSDVNDKQQPTNKNRLTLNELSVTVKPEDGKVHVSVVTDVGATRFDYEAWCNENHFVSFFDNVFKEISENIKNQVFSWSKDFSDSSKSTSTQDATADKNTA